MTDQCDVSIVVPTYNERERLEELVAAVSATCEAHGIEGEIVVVDDNSPDGTGRVADGLVGRFPVQVIHRARKLGLGSAVLDGFRAARGEMLGVMDADFSHPPSVVPAMLASLRALGVDAVVASRYIPGGGATNWPFTRLVMSRLACVLARPLTPVRDATSGLFLAKRSAVQGVQASATGFKICLELLMRSRIGSVAEIPYVFCDRVSGASKLNTREVWDYLPQLCDLYVVKFVKGGTPRARYQRVSEDELRRLTRDAFPRRALAVSQS